jgi:hypothetical protein
VPHRPTKGGDSVAQILLDYGALALLSRLGCGTLLTWVLPCGVVPMSIRSFVTAVVFDPEAFAATDEAFAAAFEALDDMGQPK